jgi:hypothetical protein
LSTPDLGYDSNFTEQLGLASKRRAAAPVAKPNTKDPTFEIRRKQANLCEAVMRRVVDLEDSKDAPPEELPGIVSDVAKKLRAAVVANT